jgi:HEAT repeats
LVATQKTTGSRARAVARALLAALFAAQVLAISPRTSVADDDAAIRALATAGDFRLRVAAALTLGKSTSPGARLALERALGDAQPAVRSAAAAALGSLGDPAALGPLRVALAVETTPGVKAQIDSTVKRLSAVAVKPRFLVSVGKLENKSGDSTTSLTSTLKASTRSRIALVSGVELLAEGTDAAAEGKSRSLPSFTLDGSLTQLQKHQGSDGVGYAARVEYVIRRMPEQTLKGTMSGSAQALADAVQVRGPSELAQLQSDAIGGAVDTALKGAGKTLEAAAR